VPLLTGFNSGEIRSLRSLMPPAVADAAAYEKEIRARYSDLADAFLALYPSSHLEESMLATTRDALYGWTAQRLVIKQTKAGVPSFLYLFDHGVLSTDGVHRDRPFTPAEEPALLAYLRKLQRWQRCPAPECHLSRRRDGCSNPVAHTVIVPAASS
jgi:para-nitrobenzyl esterase